ncbi:MAG: lipase family protein [Bacteroidetes bacterium]|nr:lipase family protein [Bacteroidota bacterium]
MTKTCFLFLAILFAFQCSAKLEPGFDKAEAKDMIAICNSFTFLDLYNDDARILPSGYEKRYTSGTFGMDSKYQVYVKDEVAVVNFRGSTEKQLSWIQNIYASMIPATGMMNVDGNDFEYCFAKDPLAAVHSGYALSVGFLHNELLYQIKNLNREGIYNIILTGHSQGGAIANLFRAYLENLPGRLLSKRNKFKTYAFATPMTGNKLFANEYNSRFGIDGTSFNIVNPADLIPTFPLNYNDTSFVKDNVNSFLFGNDFSFKKMLMDGGVRMFDGKLSRLMGSVGKSANKKISKDVSDVKLPPPVEDINYFKLESRIELSEFDYPKILKDSSILQNDSLLQIYERGEDGYFLDHDLYKSSSWTWQHKPYNYYVEILKNWFPAEYELLKLKYLRENI